MKGQPKAESLTSPVVAAFLKYERAIKRVICRITHSRADADDLAQDVYLRVTAAERNTQISNAKAYLFEAARNAARTELSKQTRRVLEAINEAKCGRAAISELSAEAVSIGRERLAIFAEAVKQLPPQCRAVFVMCKVDGRSYREISESLGISESTVEKHIGTGLTRCAAYIRSQESGAEQPVKALDTRRRL